LRETLDSLLDESLQRSERNAQLLTALLVQAEKTPGQVVDLLKPEFVQLHQEMRQAETRLAARLGDEGDESAQTSAEPVEPPPDRPGGLVGKKGGADQEG
jgi:hypothetical protein